MNDVGRFGDRGSLLDSHFRGDERDDVDVANPINVDRRGDHDVGDEPVSWISTDRHISSKHPVISSTLTAAAD